MDSSRRLPVALGAGTLLLGSLLVACNSSLQPASRPGISGNWYATDPRYVPDPANPISGVGFALSENNGTLSGNVTPYLLSNQVACDSLAFHLPATGTIDQANHLNLSATDGIVSFKFEATLDSTGTLFSEGNYTVTGAEAYPMTDGIGVSSASPSSCSGVLKGQSLPPLGDYSGSLIASNGASVDASITLQQSQAPYIGSGFGPSIILQGREPIYPSGFAVSGGIELKNSVCGVTGATVQPKEGYLFGNYVVVEFDTDTSYKTGVALAFSIDPASGNLALVPNDFIKEYNGDCYIAYVAGNLTRQP